MIPQENKEENEDHFERERLWGRFEDHFRVGDHFGVRTILRAVQYLTSKELSGINL